MKSLAGRTAWITGSSRGIGAAIAEHLACCGANIVVHGLDATETEAIRQRCQSHGVRATAIHGDLIEDQPHSIERLVELAFAADESIDLLVANAGTYIDRPFLEMPYETLERTFRLNVFSHFLTVQHVSRRWLDRGITGRIVIVGSINGRLSEDVHVAYDASKGAVEAMVRSMAVSLAPLGIRVNGMAPGLVYTPLTAPALDDPRFRAWMQWHTPNRQVPGPEACGPAVEFLLSDGAWHVHGQMLFVDGGMSIWQQPDLPPAADAF